MREDTMVTENSVLALARIATQLREIAAELDAIAVEAVTQENQGTIALPERISTSYQEAKTRSADPVSPAPKTSRQSAGSQFRPGVPRFGGGANPLFGFLTGMGGGNPLAALLGGAGGANPLAALLGGGGAGGANPLAALLGGGAGGANPLAALLGGGAGGANPLAALLGGGGGANPLASLLGQNGDLSAILKNPEALSALLSGDKSALDKLKNQSPVGEKESPGDNSQPAEEPAPQHEGPSQEQPGQTQAPFVNPAYQPYPPGSHPFYQPYYPMSSPYHNMRGRHPFSAAPFVPPVFSFSAARMIRTPTQADAQYLDTLLRKWQIY